MKSTALAVSALVSVFCATSLQAQSSEAFAGWAGLVSTPVGGLTPDIVPPGGEEGFGVRARYGHWQFDEDDDNTTNLGFGISFGDGQARTTLEVGRRSVKHCDDCDGFLAGIDVDVAVLERPLDRSADGDATGRGRLGVSVRPAIGYMTITGDKDLSTLALGLSVPVSLAVPIGERGRLVPFVAPGFGLGLVSSGDDSETGTRVLLGGGLALADLAPGLRVTGSFSKIFIEDGATVYGVGLSWSR